MFQTHNKYSVRTSSTIRDTQRKIPAHDFKPICKELEECCEMSNLNQNGFTIFATWSCQTHGCGCVRVHWAQRKITRTECNCIENNRNELLADELPQVF